MLVVNSNSCLVFNATTVARCLPRLQDCPRCAYQVYLDGALCHTSCAGNTTEADTGVMPLREYLQHFVMLTLSMSYSRAPPSHF